MLPLRKKVRRIVLAILVTHATSFAMVIRALITPAISTNLVRIPIATGVATLITDASTLIDAYLHASS
jgi:hypothetical protein